jgi:hypothetical protein
VHRNGDAHESSRTAPAQLHRLKNLLQRGDAAGFASELNLDPVQTREWFARGFTQDGYGADVITAMGTLVLTRILVPRAEASATTETGTAREPALHTEAGTPLWVKVFATVFFGVVLLFLIMMFTRGPHRGPGQHGPARHGIHGNPGGHAPAASHR